MAITGPFTAVDVDTNTAWRRRTWRRQTKPRVLRLAYSVRDQRITSRSGTALNGLRGSDTTFHTGAVSGADTASYNKAYAKFVSEVGDSASWAVTLAERRQAVGMIVKRTSQILAFTRALRKGRFGDAWDALDVPRNHPARKVKHLRKKDLSGRYLEFHFGWSPLMSDIYTSCEILGRDFPIQPVRGRGGSTASGNRGSSSDQPLGTESVSTKCQILADVVVSNPNTLMWSQMGLVNPLMIAWEVVPFSFVVDWFVNVGEYLSHFTDFTGMSISNISVTYTRKLSGELWYSGTGGWPTARMNRQWFWMDRLTPAILPGPVLSFRPWKGFSVRRGLAAVSLLIQNLPKR